MKSLLFTIDLEEFDMPKEHGIKISKKEEYDVSKKGLINLIKILDKHKIKTTFFTTTDFAKSNPSLIKKLSKIHEIAYHGYSHSENHKKISTKRLIQGKKELEKIIGKKVTGFRGPRFEFSNYKTLKKLNINNKIINYFKIS